MRDLIARAYGVSFFQISGNLPTDTYDVNTILPEGTTLPQFQQMLRSLLLERFRLQVRQEKKDFPAYELVVARAGIKLKESDPRITIPTPEGFPPVPAGQATWISQNRLVDGYRLVRITARQQPVSVLAQIGSSSTPNNEPIVDRTGLTGKYDFVLEHTVDIPGPQPDRPPPAPSLFTAIREQLGLDLVSKKVPFDHIIVESFDRAPAEN